MAPHGIWIATESRMTDLKQRTHSTMHAESLNANPDLDDRAFSYSRLGHRDP